MTELIADLDCETTRADLGRRAWDIGLITPDGREYEWFVDIRDLDLPNADPVSLDIGGFWRRHPQASRVPLVGNLDGIAVELPAEPPKRLPRREAEVLAEVGELTDGVIVHGSNPDFDRYTLWPRMAFHGIEPRWYYRAEDVATLVRGYLTGAGLPIPRRPDGKVKSDDLSRAVGIDPDRFGRHTALGDCRWMRAVREAVDRLRPAATHPTNIDGAADQIAAVLRGFPFWDYGMDDVDPRSEYAEWVPALAERIAALDLCRGAQVEEDDIRARERRRVARYLERMAEQKLRNARDSVAPQFRECEAMVLREAVTAIREPSVWAPEDSDGTTA